MPAKIPKNNLKERLIKLGYNPNSVVITQPVLDNSKVVVVPKKSQTQYQNYLKPTEQDTLPVAQIKNIEEWSDFEDE